MRLWEFLFFSLLYVWKGSKKEGIDGDSLPHVMTSFKEDEGTGFQCQVHA